MEPTARNENPSRQEATKEPGKDRSKDSHSLPLRYAPDLPLVGGYDDNDCKYSSTLIIPVHS